MRRQSNVELLTLSSRETLGMASLPNRDDPTSAGTPTAPQHPHACSRKVPSSERARTCQSHPPPHAGSRAKWAKGWSFTQAQHSCSRTKPFPDPKCGRLARSKPWAPGIIALGVGPLRASDALRASSLFQGHPAPVAAPIPPNCPNSCPVCSRARCPSSRSRLEDLRAANALTQPYDA